MLKIAQSCLISLYLTALSSRGRSFHFSRFVKYAEMMDMSVPIKEVDILIVGGGLCGVLAAHRCDENALSYCLIERQSDFGGVWASLANEHSHLQVKPFCDINARTGQSCIV